MKTFTLIVILCLCGFTAHASRLPRSESFTNTFEVQLKENDKIVKAQSSVFETGLLVSKFSRTHFLAQKFRPQSINSVRIRAKEVSADLTRMRTLKSKKGVIFIFEDAKFFYFYSTIGGRLLVSKNNKEKFDVTRVSLKIRKPSSSVANL